METRVFHGLKLTTFCGGGAYGEVYYGEDITAKKMAVKIISKKKLGDEWKKTLRGVKNYRTITENAPELLRIYHVEEDEDSFFYTMEAADPVGTDEYVPDTLARRLDPGPLPPEQLYSVLHKIFSGILLIHRAGFAHRDIKPDNILFVDGSPKLADIDLLSPLSTTMTLLAGTPAFIPPEALSAGPSDSSDHRSRQRNDLYAFGKVIYCAVTGMDPGKFPSPPADLPIKNLPVKYFFRLARRLCDKDPARRLDSIDVLEREFKEIDRILTRGETPADRFLYALRHSADYLRSACRFLRRFWYLALLFLLLGGTVSYLYLRYLSGIGDPSETETKTGTKPETEVQTATKTAERSTIPKTKTYVNEKCKISMTIPATWEELSPDTYRTLVRKGADALPENLRKFLVPEAEKGINMIQCDFDPVCSDNIVINPVPQKVTKKEFEKEDPDVFKLIIKNQLENTLGWKAVFYESKKSSVAGYPCVFLDCSYHYQTDIRANTYIIYLGDNHIVEISLTAKSSTYEQRRKEFEAALQTLKILP